MIDWWYADKDKKIGPVKKDEIKRLLQTGQIGAKTLLWHEGMETWQSFDKVDELKKLDQPELKVSVPPPLPSQTELDPVSYPLATRWPRFFARIFDVWWETLLVSIILAAVLGRYSPSFVEWINVSPDASKLFPILCLPIALILDALLYRVFGNTPGKALLGLKVGTLDGKPLGLYQYLGRNFSIWSSGLAFGIPLINLFTMGKQSVRLGEGKQASYDEPMGYRVRSKPCGWVRRTGFVFAFAGLFVVMAILNGTEQTVQSEAILEYYTWENPVTRLNAKIDSRWKYTSQTNDDGQQINMFSERTDHAVVILVVEQAPGYTFDDYIRAFQKSTAANMRFSDDGVFFEKGGRQIWQGTGSQIDNTSNRLNVRIMQIDSAFWRVITIQTMPYGYSDPLVVPLQDALWGTVK